MVETRFNPEMLTLGRRLRGISQRALADSVVTTQGRLSKIEHGMLVPPPDLLDKLGDALRVPPSFFLQAGHLNGLPTWFHRRRKRISQVVLEQIHAEIERRVLQIRELLRSADVQVTTPLPQVDLDEMDGGAAQVARYVRQALGVAPGAIKDLVQLAEDAGVIVVPCDFGNTGVDAVGLRAPLLPPLVFLNMSVPADRQRFTLAHELGHLVMHWLPTNEMEGEAHEFASEFLMPELDIRPHLTRVDLAALAVLKKIWRVSMAALLERARRLKAITQVRYVTLRKQLNAYGFTRREPAELDFPHETPRLLGSLLAFFRESLGYSSHQLMQSLHTREHDFQLMWQPAKRQNLRLVAS